MTLNRVWKPSPNYSASRSRNQLIVVHTSEGSTDQLGLAAYLANPSSQVSYHVCYDNQGDVNTIVECVRRNNKSWSAMSANDWGVHGCCCTPSGASAGWTRDVWLSHSTMLEKCARWIAEEAGALGIPLVKVDANGIRAGGRGVCGHGDCSAAGAGGSHYDPGNNFPWDHVLALAGGSAPVPGPTPPTSAAPPFPGTLLVNFTTGHGTATWQRQMANRGWTITVDDMYGNQSTNVCRQFQAEKGLGVDGIVGPITWDAAWTAPIT